MIILTYATHVIACLLGVSAKIAHELKKESDTYEKLEEDFDANSYIRKNIWDFVYYIASGLALLACKSLLKEYVPIEGLTDFSLSCLSGLLGAKVISSLTSK